MGIFRFGPPLNQSGGSSQDSYTLNPVVTGATSDGQIGSTCCNRCCSYECELNLGDLSFTAEIDQTIRPVYHPEGYASETINIYESYRFYPWSALNGNAYNLPNNTYTAYFYRDCDGCCGIKVTFGSVGVQWSGDVTIYIGGDTEDLSSYETGTVTYQYGWAYWAVGNCASGGTYAPASEGAAVFWNLGGGPLDPITEWGPKVGSVDIGPAWELRGCSPKSLRPMEFEEDAEEVVQPIPGNIDLKHCWPSRFTQTQRAELGLPKFPTTCSGRDQFTAACWSKPD